MPLKLHLSLISCSDVREFYNADNAIFKNRAQTIECSFDCVHEAPSC